MSESNVYYYSIEDLPDEVLEYVLSLIPPYKDIHECMQVSKRWRRCVLNVVKIKKRNLHRAIGDFDVKWHLMRVQESPPGITKRYSHSSVIYGNFMYVFGGCTCSMTTFNDLWKLDLSTRQWVRPLTMGSYPSPKACSSLVCYKDILVLFGGWTYPPSYPLYQTWHLFNELHVYDILANRWVCINTINSPPPMAGHSVSVVGEWMIIFAGLHKPDNAVHCEKSNDVWRLNLESWVWEKKMIADGPKPTGRVGQTQVVLDDTHILIMGGSGGPSHSYSDVWILNMTGDVWSWKEIELRGEKYKPSNIWSNPGCKVGDKIVVLNRIREIETPPIVYYPKNTWLTNRTEHVDDGKSARIDLANRVCDKDENVNGRRGTLRNQRREPEDVAHPHPHAHNQPNSSWPRCICGTSHSSAVDNVNIRGAPQNSYISMAAFSTRDENTRSRADVMRDRRLATLEKLNVERKKLSYKKDIRRQYMGIYVLDLSHALEDNPFVTWLPPKNCESGPEETVLYSLVEGKSELVMFGGIQQEAGTLKLSSNISNQISNSVYFIAAPNYII